ncbi:unnamed protein product [Caenorhabditis nigoni]
MVPDGVGVEGRVSGVADISNPDGDLDTGSEGLTSQEDVASEASGMVEVRTLERFTVLNGLMDPDDVLSFTVTPIPSKFVILLL